MGPANGSKLRAEDDALAEAGTLEPPAEAEVFEDFHRLGLKAAEGLVGGAADQIESADAEEVAGPWVGDAP